MCFAKSDRKRKASKAISFDALFFANDFSVLRIIDLRLQESGIDFKPEGVVLFLVECDLGFDLIPERLNLVEVR